MPAPKTILCDVDGVIWLSRTPLPGAVEAFHRVLDAGHELFFVTNNSYSTLEDQEAVFARIGIEATNRLLTSSMAAASLVTPGSTAVVGGGPGVFAALHQQGVEAIDVMHATQMANRTVSDVVVGFHRDFDFQRLHVLSSFVRSGARLIGTNEDPTYPTESGVIPGGGSILAAVATAGGVEPIVAGKPHAPMAALVRERLGGREMNDVWMVGDRLSTDGRFAAMLGCSFAHVRSSVQESITDVLPTRAVPSFAAFVDFLLSDQSA